MYLEIEDVSIFFSRIDFRESGSTSLALIQSLIPRKTDLKEETACTLPTGLAIDRCGALTFEQKFWSTF
jgi:hypothetical protein